MIRKAVGAVIFRKKKNAIEFLLVHKVKFLDEIDMKGEWGFSKGGIKKGETLLVALKRELREETGTEKYEIIKKFKDKIKYKFSRFITEKNHFEGQEITMFLVKYVGNDSELKPQDDEIDRLKFFNRDDLLKTLHHEDAKKFFRKNISKL